MKPLLIFLSLISLNCYADSFTIIRDGVQYTCESQNNPPDSDGTAGDCAVEAYHGPFTREEAMTLCTGARGVGPAECAIAAYHGPFTREEAIQLCQRTGTQETADCAINAYHGPYTREEAIKLCRTNARLLLRTFRILHSSPEARMLMRTYPKD